LCDQSYILFIYLDVLVTNGSTKVCDIHWFIIHVVCGI